MFNIWYPNWNAIQKTCQSNAKWVETAFPQLLCTMDWVSSWNNYLLLLAELAFWVGIIKQLFSQLLTRYLIYLARENRYWDQLTLRPISALPCQIKQILYSSLPNNCIIYNSLERLQFCFYLSRGSIKTCDYVNCFAIINIIVWSRSNVITDFYKGHAPVNISTALFLLFWKYDSKNLWKWRKTTDSGHYYDCINYFTKSFA